MSEHSVKRKARDLQRLIRQEENAKKKEELIAELYDVKATAGKKGTNMKRMSIKKLEREGYEAGDVESYNAYAKRSKDLFGCFDVVAVHPKKKGTLYVQVTSKANIATRQKKVMATPVTRTILKAGNKVEVHGWVKVGRGFDVEIRELKLKTTPKKK